MAQKPDRSKAWHAVYYQQHKERIKARVRARRLEKLAEIQVKDRQYHQRNKAKRNAQMREWRRNNPERVRELNREWRSKNPERSRAHDRKRQVEHRDEINAYNRMWAKTHPESARARVRRRRALKVGAAGEFTLKEWMDKCELFNHRCFYCGETRPLVPDHDIPLSRGGSNYISNIIPACSSCNAGKRDKTAKEFLDWRGRRT